MYEFEMFQRLMIFLGILENFKIQETSFRRVVQ